MLSFSRMICMRFFHNNRMPSFRVSRKMSITCRGNYWSSSILLRPLIIDPGKPISHEDLYQYTNGRFLKDEKYQYERRYVRFSLDRLCDIAASVGTSKSPISAVEKMEGGFSKALLLRKEDGTELIAKISCPNAGPPMYTTASEVAVL